VSPAAPYRHFRDRDDLLIDVARRGFDLFAAALARAWDDGRPDAFAAFERVVLTKDRERLSLDPMQLRRDGNELPA